MQADRNISLRENFEELLSFRTALLITNLFWLSVAEEANPISAAEDDLVHDHVLECEGLHATTAHLGPSLIADHGESNLASIVL